MGLEFKPWGLSSSPGPLYLSDSDIQTHDETFVVSFCSALAPVMERKLHLSLKEVRNEIESPPNMVVAHGSPPSKIRAY